MELRVLDTKAIRKLLLAPSPANLAQVTDRLEALADCLRSLQLSAANARVRNPEVESLLRALGPEMSRLRRLLDRSARFYNGLSGLGQPTGYGQNGMLRSEQGARRTLARL